MSSLRSVAVLCAARKTSYRDLPGLEIYDIDRDAWTFQGGMPVIAHPPCRRWTKFGRDMLKGFSKRHPGHELPSKDSIEAEKQLGLLCARMVQENGGILEQPANSGLWESAGLPLPGSPQSPNSFSLAVWQAWWGYPAKKGTWLYFRGISQFSIEIPFRLHPFGNDKRYYDHKITGWLGQRSMTVPALARWLVDLARTVSLPYNQPIPAANPP